MNLLHDAVDVLQLNRIGVLEVSVGVPGRAHECSDTLPNKVMEATRTGLQGAASSSAVLVRGDH